MSLGGKWTFSIEPLFILQCTEVVGTRLRRNAFFLSGSIRTTNQERDLKIPISKQCFHLKHPSYSAASPACMTDIITHCIALHYVIAFSRLVPRVLAACRSWDLNDAFNFFTAAAIYKIKGKQKTIYSRDDIKKSLYWSRLFLLRLHRPKLLFQPLPVCVSFMCVNIYI